jgi:hypothetical protein
MEAFPQRLQVGSIAYAGVPQALSVALQIIS